jgi:restriction system protein
MALIRPAKNQAGTLKGNPVLPPRHAAGRVLYLMMAMGYGGVAGHGTVTGKSGDGDIDSVIKRHMLGLDVVCIQAKRWDRPVGRPVIQGFVDGMDYIRARKGTIMTTSLFTKDAVDFVERIEGKMVLIDGEGQ